MPDAKQLGRIHRVRTLQLALARAGEALAQDKVASELALRGRVLEMAAAVSPAASTQGAFSLGAAAHYRERLHQSAQAADTRIRAAEIAAARAADATREARRDQTAAEKLLARAELDRALADLRAMQDAPPVRKVRHDPC